MATRPARARALAMAAVLLMAAAGCTGTPVAEAAQEAFDQAVDLDPDLEDRLPDQGARLR